MFVLFICFLNKQYIYLQNKTKNIKQTKQRQKQKQKQTNTKIKQQNIYVFEKNNELTITF